MDKLQRAKARSIRSSQRRRTSTSLFSTASSMDSIPWFSQLENKKAYLPPKTIFLGTPAFASIVLKKLAELKILDITFAVTREDKPAGRGRKVVLGEVHRSANDLNLPVVFDNSKSELVSKIKDSKPDILLVAAYGRIISNELLSIPKYGCVNVHPSLLPKYRGASPIQSAIISGDKKTGVTLIKMNEKTDEGDIIVQKEIEIYPKDTAESLTNRLAEVAAELIDQNINKYIKGDIKPISQDPQKATYCKLIRKENGKIDWSEDGSLIERKIRAFYPWPTAWMEWKGNIVKFLPEGRIQLSGKRAMTFEEFLRGHPDFTLPKQLSW